jgi:hypothetical protein
MQKEKQYTKHTKTQNTVLKIQNKRQTSKGYKNVIMLLQDYLPMEREEKNSSNVRHSTARYMVLGVCDGRANGQLPLLLKATMHMCVVANCLCLSVLFLSCSSAEGNRTENDKHERVTDVSDLQHDTEFSKWRAS